MKASGRICFAAPATIVLLSAIPQARAWQEPEPAAPATSQQDSANELFVSAGKSVLIDTARSIQRVAVGSPEIAEATAVTPRSIMVNGKAAGDTSLIVWQAGGGRQFYNVVVRPSSSAVSDRLEGIRHEIRTELPSQQIRVSSENGLIFLHGTVKDLTSSNRAVQIASTAGKVVNLLYVTVPTADPQILLKVRFASLDRTKERQFGLNFYSLGAANSIGGVSTGQFSPPSVSNPSGSSPLATITDALNLSIFRPDLNLGATLRALENNNVLQVLAEPNVLASNGKQASFLAGGEYPYPTVQGVTGGGTGAVTIQFKEFGVRLNFIPTITPRNTIRLQVAPEVSSLDFTNGIQLSGFTVPGLTVRRVKTEVELSEGQSFAIGGLIDNRETEIFQKIPFIGDIPVLGKLFQSIQRTKNNTELIVIVTPEIVNPIPAGSTLPSIKFPQSFLEPTDDPKVITNANSTATPLEAAKPSMPIETLLDSMQPEQPLATEGSYSPGGFSTGGGSSSSSTPH